MRWGESEVSYLRAHENGGSPVVLLHGLGGCAAVWSRNFEGLATRHDVYAPELWGPGRFNPGEPVDVDAGVRFLSGFMDSLGIASAHLVGGSLGGLLAGVMALREPNRVTSLTLVASAGFGKKIAWSQRLLTLPGVGELCFRPNVRRARSLVGMLVPDAKSTDDLVDELVRVSRQEGVTRQMLAALRAGIGLRGVKPSALLLPHMADLRAPTLVCWGTKDPLFPMSHAHTAAEGIPNAVLRVFPRAGHWPFYEQTEAFNEAALAHFGRAELLSAQSPRSS